MNKKEIWILIIIMSISLYIAQNWDSLPVIKDNVEKVLNPSLGYLLEKNIYIGFIIIIGIISFLLTLSQKYFSDQKALKELKEEQKILQEEMKKYRDHPEKLIELQKKQLEFLPKTMNLTLKPMMVTSIPIILLFRWFSSYLLPVFGNWWIFFYLIGSMIFSSIFRKWLNVV